MVIIVPNVVIVLIPNVVIIFILISTLSTLQTVIGMKNIWTVVSDAVDGQNLVKIDAKIPSNSCFIRYLHKHMQIYLINMYIKFFE